MIFTTEIYIPTSDIMNFKVDWEKSKITIEYTTYTDEKNRKIDIIDFTHKAGLLRFTSELIADLKEKV